MSNFDQMANFSSTTNIASTSTGSNSSSVAKNYAKNFLTQVNPRTGLLSVTIPSPPLKGILSMDVNLGITYAQETVGSYEQLFGLPVGWSYSLSYINDGILTLNGSQTYVLSPESPSGLQYYYQKNLEMTQYSPGQYPNLPYDPSTPYAYLLTFLDGHHQYFDAQGKLICWDDKNGNHLLFTYDSSDASITQAKLISVTDAYGQNLSISLSSDSIDVIYPKSDANPNPITYSYQLLEGALVSYIDPMGLTTHFIYNGGLINSKLLSNVNYPNKVSSTFDYSTIYYKDSSGQQEQQDVVSKVINTYEEETRSTTYNYHPEQSGPDGHNYLGNPTYEVASTTSDTLFQSDDNNYRYYTTINNNKTLVVNQYNNLHLLLKSTTFTADGSERIQEIVYTYVGETDGDFPPYNQLDPNYQLIAEKLSTFYNEQEDTRPAKIIRSYTDNGQIASIEEYEQIEGELQLVKKGEVEYDISFGMPTSVKVYDYKPRGVLSQTPEIIRTDNKLSDDKKHILTSTRGTEVNGLLNPLLVTSVEYDTAGRPSSSTRTWGSAAPDHSGIAKTNTTFENILDSTAHTLTHATTDFFGNTSNEVYDLCTGFPISTSNAVGAITTYNYDLAEATVIRTDSMGNTTTWSYDLTNNIMRKLDANGYEQKYYYNGFGQLIQQSDYPVKGGAERTLTTNTYDQLGRLSVQLGVLGEASKVTYAYNSRSQLASKTDALGNISGYEYDSVACTKASSFNSLKSTEVTYGPEKSGGPLLSKFKKRAKKEYKQRLVASAKKFDRHNANQYACATRLWNAFQLNVQTSIGDQQTPQQFSLARSYNILQSPTQYCLGGANLKRTLVASRDLNGNMLQSTCTLEGTSQTEASSNRSYNELGEFTQEATLTEQARKFSYDAVGNRTQITQFNGSQVNSTYDLNKRVSSHSYTENGSSIEIHYEYDGVGQRTSIERFVDGESDALLSYTYTLDGNISSISYPDGKTVSWNYDVNTGLLTSSIDALGHQCSYSYDSYGRLAKIARDDGSVSVGITYITQDIDKANVGKIASVSYSNGVKLAYTYNGFGRPQQITATSTGEDEPITLTYSYDATTSFVTAISYRHPGGSSALNRDVSFVYDDVGQVIGESSVDPQGNPLETVSYGYDALANIKTCTRSLPSTESADTKYTYDADNRLKTISVTGAPDQALSYDENNNLIKDENGNSYQYNALNQLTQFTSSDGENTTYTYYPNGLRATKQTGDEEIIHYYYDNASNANIINEVQGDSEASYIISASSRLARMLKKDSSSELQSYLLDRQNVLLTFGNSGSISSEYVYNAYGNCRSSQNGSIADNPFAYCGEYADSESSLLYLRARYYAAQRMRFVSRDSFLVINPYTYADGNPVMKQDPSGHLSTAVKIGIGVGSAVGATIFGFGAWGAWSHLVRGQIDQDGEGEVLNGVGQNYGAFGGAQEFNALIPNFGAYGEADTPEELLEAVGPSSVVDIRLENGKYHYDARDARPGDDQPILDDAQTLVDVDEAQIQLGMSFRTLPRGINTKRANRNKDEIFEDGGNAGGIVNDVVGVVSEAEEVAIFCG
ncbi:RHS repeat domain-containing protein [Microbulbifer sp. SSSA008]|uniref:RHS repeat domain-containing protein n=1 Tax=Microbulbifer sp. SSSA008 TaxID=3243380 RepID=UPI004038FEA6